MATETLSAKQVALEVGTDARNFRKFLRDVTPRDDQPGQGGRWTFTRGEATKIAKRFAKWAKDNAAATEAAEKAASTNGGTKAKAEPVAKAKPAKAKKGKAPKPLPEPEELEEVDLELGDLDDPDAEELEESEDEDIEDLGEDED